NGLLKIHDIQNCRGVRSPAHPLRRAGLASHVLDDRDGALAHERYWNGLGAHAVGRGAEGGVGGAKKDYRRRRLHVTPASPARPEPRRRSVEGSGTTVCENVSWNFFSCEVSSSSAPLNSSISVTTKTRGVGSSSAASDALLPPPNGSLKINLR